MYCYLCDAPLMENEIYCCECLPDLRLRRFIENTCLCKGERVKFTATKKGGYRVFYLDEYWQWSMIPQKAYKEIISSQRFQDLCRNFELVKYQDSEFRCSVCGIGIKDRSQDDLCSYCWFNKYVVL